MVSLPLWDIWEMLEIRSKALLKVMGSVSHLRGGLQVVTRMPPMENANGPPRPWRYGLSNLDFDLSRAEIAALPDELDRLELPVSAQFARDLLVEFDRVEPEPDHESVTWPWSGSFMRALDRVVDAIPAEIGTRTALIIPTDRAKLYKGERQVYSSLVRARFPGASKDFSESERCYALSAYTASVFHSIRCLEAGLRAVARCLSIPDPTKGSQRNWHFALDAIEKKILTKWPDASDRFDGDGSHFELVHGALKGMQNPYRNATMHLDQFYDEEDARHIMEMVAGFLRTVAQRCDENGDPKA